MKRHRHLRKLAVAVFLLLAACTPPDETRETAGGGRDLDIAFEDTPRPDVLSRTGNARRDDSSTAAPGLWAVVPGLSRAERAEVESLASGARVMVSLFAGNPGSGAAIRLSPQAADILGVLDAPVPVRITAIRREPVLIQ